jgi:hypothetical protein
MVERVTYQNNSPSDGANQRRYASCILEPIDPRHGEVKTNTKDGELKRQNVAATSTGVSIGSTIDGTKAGPASLTCMSAIIYDFTVLSAKLRKQRIDDRWQPWRPEPQVAKPSLVPNEIWRCYLSELLNRVDPK